VFPRVIPAFLLCSTKKKLKKTGAYGQSALIHNSVAKRPDHKTHTHRLIEAKKTLTTAVCFIKYTFIEFKLDLPWSTRLQLSEQF